jgi:GNAT superfamily N-acetyltransferase
MRQLDITGFAKPRALCFAPVDPPDPVRAATLCQQRLDGLGLAVRSARPDDIGSLRSFMERRLPPASQRTLGPYDLYRVLQFGGSVLLEDRTATVQGFFFEQRYGDAARTSYCVSVAVAEHLAGHGIGAELVRYAGYRAAAAGCTVQRAVLSPHNLASGVTFFNRVGHIAEDFYAKLDGYGESRFAVCCGLGAEGLGANRVDPAAAQRLVANGSAGRDYLLVDVDDRAIDRLYRAGLGRVVAVLSAGSTGTPPRLLALPDDCLDLSRV